MSKSAIKRLCLILSALGLIVVSLVLGLSSNDRRMPSVMTSTTLSPDGKVVVAALQSGGVWAWEWQREPSTQRIDVVTSNNDPCVSLDFSPDGTVLAVTTNTSISFLSYPGFVAKYKTVHIPHPASRVSWLHDGTRIAIGCSNGRAYILDLPSTVVTEVTSEFGFQRDLIPAFIDHDTVLFGGDQGSIYRYSLSRRSNTLVVTYPTKIIRALAACDNLIVVSVSDAQWKNGALILHAIDSGKSDEVDSPGERDAVKALSVNCRHGLIAAAGQDGKLRLRGMPGGESKAVIRCSANELAGVSMSGLGDTLTTLERYTQYGSVIRLWKAANGEALGAFYIKNGVVIKLASRE
ncbi:MAG: WD40 repeat domain-containing protein [Planctomycetota bacterium]